MTKTTIGTVRDDVPQHNLQSLGVIRMRMHHLILAAALMLGAPADSAATPGDVVYTLCPGWPNTLAFKSLQFDPNPPTIKKPFTIIANGTLATTIQPGAKVTVTQTLGTMLVSQSNLDLCAEASLSGMTCPIAPGLHAFRGSYTPAGTQIPPFVTIKVHVEAYNGDGSKLLCLDTGVKYAP